MIDVSELSDEEIQRVLNMRGFQKMLAYSRLEDGIEVLEDEDQIFESLVTNITKQHSQVRSEETVREFFTLFRKEVQAFTEGLADEDQDGSTAELRDLVVDEETESGQA